VGVTANYNLPYPLSSEAADVPTDIQELADGTDAALHGVEASLGGRVGTLETQVAAFVTAEPGDLKASARATPSAGWLLCDGSAVSRSTYSALFTAIGTSYGAGDGASTFNLPDFRGRTIVGVGPHADVNGRGLNDGQLPGNRRPRHKHSVTDPTHSHQITTAQGGGEAVPTLTAPSYTPTVKTFKTPTDAAATGVAVGPQTGAEPVDAPAYLTANVFIKT
jgi:microcystin-dependent protein